MIYPFYVHKYVMDCLAHLSWRVDLINVIVIHSFCSILVANGCQTTPTYISSIFLRMKVGTKLPDDKSIASINAHSLISHNSRKF